MKTQNRILLSVFVALGALTQPAVAKADTGALWSLRDFDWAERYMTEICFLRPDTQAGITSVKLWPIFTYPLVHRFPDRLSLVEPESCDDAKDNDCDGLVNEGCPVEPEFQWYADEACDTCMEASCGDEASRCLAEQGCVDAITCAGQSNCLDRFTGPLACLCGEGVSIPECQNTSIGALEGACVEHFLPDEFGQGSGQVPFVLVDGDDSRSLANVALICMGRKCRDACADNIYNYEVPSCGNGVKEEGEDCDDGNDDDADACTNECKKTPVCGDGILDEGEFCDDGNTVYGDGCSPDCRSGGPSCGNGLLENDEACDDGNLIPGDGCSPECTFEGDCGNGIVELNEECDDGNEDDFDGCSTECKIQYGSLFGPGAPYNRACDECLETECGEITNACVMDDSCRRVGVCFMREQCVTRSIGGLSCLCGLGVSVPECQAATEFQGACADVLLQEAGVSETDNRGDAVNYIFSEEESTRNATMMAACMARKCSASCDAVAP